MQSTFHEALTNAFKKLFQKVATKMNLYPAMIAYSCINILLLPKLELDVGDYLWPQGLNPGGIHISCTGMMLCSN